MIVVDTNVIAYLLIPGEHTEGSKKLFRRDPHWAAPILWRSEFLNVLAAYLKSSLLSIDQCIQYIEEAESILGGNQYSVSHGAVLRLVKQSSCTAYDCEFVALADQLATPLLTTDRLILKQFPEIAISLKEY